MPHSALHKKKLKKNLVIAGLVFLWCALIWAVTMVKMANAQTMPPRYVGKNFSGINIQRAPVDIKGPLYNSRAAHRAVTDERKQGWDSQYYRDAERRYQAGQAQASSRQRQLDIVTNRQDGWTETWLRDSDRRMDKSRAVDQARRAQRDLTYNRPYQWWDEWETRQQQRRD